MVEITGDVLTVGRYALHDAIASGGMGTVHLGRALGAVGFARTVAIKRLHPQFLTDPSFVLRFADEARLAACIHHPNVVPTLDVVSCEGELLLVMEYVDGESLAKLTRGARVVGRTPLPIATAIMTEVLHGLHAAHEATSDSGEPLGIVHRDVSPQNVIVGADGVARLVDFGLARADKSGVRSRSGELKGKLAYMAPEQIRGESVTRRTDVFAAGVVLWELLTGQRLFAADNEGATLEKILVGWVAPPSSIVGDLPPALDEIVLRALDPSPARRFATAREMAVALEDAVPRALGRDVAAWVERHAAASLSARRERLKCLGAAPAPARAPVSFPLPAAPELEPTICPPLPVPPATSMRSRAVLTLLLCASLAVPVVARWAGETPAMAAPALTAEAARAVLLAPRPLPAPSPTAPSTAPASVSPASPAPPSAPLLAPAMSPAPTASPASPARHKSEVRRASRPARSAPPPAAAPAVATKAPCTSTYDAASHKTIYLGDCE